MFFSRKTILTKGKKPLYAASRVINASSAASSVFAKCWVHSTNKTSALIRSVTRRGIVFRRAYSSTNKSVGAAASGASGATEAAASSASAAGMSGAVPAGALARGLPLYRRVINAWNETPTKWYPLPLAVGALLLVVIQYRKKSRRASKEVQVDEDGNEIIKLKGPWQVHVLGALPLRNMSRLWGYINSLELPVWFRPYGIRLYAYTFGCNLDEVEHADLRHYVSLGDFFYRRLKDGVRPVEDAILVSPADGKILHFGKIQDLRVEQVKGITYSLDALLGVERPSSRSSATSSSSATLVNPPDMPVIDHREFANVNGIEYSLEQLLGTSSGTSTPATPIDESVPSTPTGESSSGLGPSPLGRSVTSSSSSRSSTPEPGTNHDASLSLEDLEGSLPHGQSGKKFGRRIDASVVEPERPIEETIKHDVEVAKGMGDVVVEQGSGDSKKPGPLTLPIPQRKSTIGSLRPGNSLYFTVIYLAPGDYHRFHSPTAWVVEKRRHFVGELFSVSPWMAKRLENLFVLNERVALLGRWKFGFFGMVPVGATNVGSIKVNFDQALRTNLRGRLPPPGTYMEAVYSAASPILNGQPLMPAQEMGGFCLGSTIVLVFEAPDEFEFSVREGEKVKVGQKVGDVPGRMKVKTE